MMPNKVSINVPEEVRALLSKGLVKKMEYGDKYIVLTIDAQKFFAEIVGSTGMEIYSECKELIVKIPVNLEELL